MFYNPLDLRIIPVIPLQIDGSGFKLRIHDTEGRLYLPTVMVDLHDICRIIIKIGADGIERSI